MVALSGGIDSSIVIFLLMKSGFYIEAIFIKNWINDNIKCTFNIDFYYVKYICKKFNIKLHILDFSKQYWNFVFTEFLKKLKLGYTPNPDILCNKKIKFNILLYYVIKNFNFDFFATGHYACIKKINNKLHLFKSFDKIKDQTYFIYILKNNIKKKIVFPLSSYSKSKVKHIIKKNKLINYNKKDSMGICFIGENKFFIFIKKYLKIKPGYIKTQNEKIIGKHLGLHFYTIGQRKNMKLQNVNKMYVYKKDIKKNLLYVITKNHISLFSRKVIISHINFKNIYITTFFCNAKIRHKAIFSQCIIKKYKGKNLYNVFFKHKQKALSIGQCIVFYINNICLGGGIIKKILF